MIQKEEQDVKNKQQGIWPDFIVSTFDAHVDEGQQMLKMIHLF